MPDPSPWKIPLFEPDITEDDIQAASRPLREKWLTMGEQTSQFETEFARQANAAHAIAVSSGTSALQLALAGLGIQAGDEVLLPSFTFVACANTILSLGATPVFVDCNSYDDWTISPEDLSRKFTPRSKAVLVVHYAGFPCRMDSIVPLAKEQNLYLVEDCAHALFSQLGGQTCGTFGEAGAFSFFSNKNMATGEGGMIVTPNESLAERLRLLRSHGMTSLTLDRHEGRAISYDVLEPGYNCRIDEMRSALGRSQLKRLDDNLVRRRELYRLYVERLVDRKDILIPFQNRSSNSIGYHIFPIGLKNPEHRNGIIQGMKEKGIQTSIHYPPIHGFSAYKNYKDHAACPITDRVAQGELTLPFYPGMSRHDLEYVCDSLQECLNQCPGV